MQGYLFCNFHPYWLVIMSPKLIFSTPFCLTQHAPAESKSPWADDVVIIKSLQCVQEKWKFRYMDRTLTSSAKNWKIKYSICFCCSVAKSCLTLCNPMDCSTPGSPVLHYLPELSQTHVQEHLIRLLSLLLNFWKTPKRSLMIFKYMCFKFLKSTSSTK